MLYASSQSIVSEELSVVLMMTLNRRLVGMRLKVITKKADQGVVDRRRRVVDTKRSDPALQSAGVCPQIAETRKVVSIKANFEPVDESVVDATEQHIAMPFGRTAHHKLIVSVIQQLNVDLAVRDLNN